MGADVAQRHRLEGLLPLGRQKKLASSRWGLPVSGPAEPRSSDRKLKPLPPDAFRHQHSAIAQFPSPGANLCGREDSLCLDLSVTCPTCVGVWSGIAQGCRNLANNCLE